MGLAAISLLIDLPYVRIGITYAILLMLAVFLYNGSQTVKLFTSIYFMETVGIIKLAVQRYQTKRLRLKLNRSISNTTIIKLILVFLIQKILKLEQVHSIYKLKKV